MRVQRAPERLSAGYKSFRANAGRLLRGGRGDCQAARRVKAQNTTVAPFFMAERRRLPLKTVAEKDRACCGFRQDPTWAAIRRAGRTGCPSDPAARRRDGMPIVSGHLFSGYREHDFRIRFRQIQKGRAEGFPFVRPSFPTRAAASGRGRTSPRQRRRGADYCVRATRAPVSA